MKRAIPALALALFAPLLGAAKIVTMPEPGSGPVSRPIWFQPERHRQIRETGQPLQAPERGNGGPRILRVPPPATQGQPQG